MSENTGKSVPHSLLRTLGLRAGKAVEQLKGFLLVLNNFRESGVDVSEFEHDAAKVDDMIETLEAMDKKYTTKGMEQL
jgi:hypothetical protein